MPNNHREERNILEAASNGATDAIALVANVAANLIAFLAVLAFVNSTLSWLGEMVDIHGLSFQVSLICVGHVFLTHSKPRESLSRRGRGKEGTAESPGRLLVPDHCLFFLFHLGHLLLCPSAHGFHDGCRVGRLSTGG